MYSNEIANYINERNYLLGGDDLNNVIDINKNPQINRIIYHPFDMSYYIATNDNYEFNFKVIPYEEAKIKKLVREIKKNWFLFL